MGSTVTPMGITATDTVVIATVQAAMGKHRITTLRLAEATGMARQTLSRRLAGTTSFTVTELERIALTLGKTPSEFFGEAA